MKCIPLGTGACFCNATYLYSSYLVDDHLLVDCGPHVEWALRMMDVAVDDLSALFFTHLDPDHVLGFPMVLPARSEGNPLPVYGPPGTLDHLENLCKISRVYHKFDRAQIVEVDLQGEFDFGPYAISTLPMVHMPESVSLSFKNDEGTELSFSGDTAMNDNLLALLARSTATVVEMTNVDTPHGKHLTLTEDLPILLENLGPESRLLLSHLGSDAEHYENAMEQMALNQAEKATILEEFEEYLI